MLLEGSLTRIATSNPPGIPPGEAGGNRPWPSAYLATRILIIEDEIMIAWMIESLLLDLGFSDIVMASDADQAISLAALSPPGLIISDINLGRGADGVEAAISIHRLKAVPVIFVTAYAERAARERITAELPNAQLLRKPVGKPALVESVERALAPSRSN